MEQELFTFIEQYIDLTAAERQAIVELDLFRTYPKGTLLVKAGDRARESYFVIKGLVRAYYIMDGEECTTSFYSEGEAFEPIFKADQTAEHYFVCLEACVLSVATPDIEQDVMSRFPRFESVCRKFSEELLAKKQLAFDQFKHATPAQRYLNLLKSRPDLIQRVPQHQIASYLGITPESLSRIRKRLMQNQKIG